MDISAILARGSSGSSGADDANIHVAGGAGGKREAQYKKKGNKLDKRALRQIQDDERRKAGRSVKHDEGRMKRINDGEEAQENLGEVGKKSGQLSRKEKLEEYLKNKKKVEMKMRKEAKPTFRPGGKYIDLNPIAPVGAASMNNSTLNNTKRVNKTGMNNSVVNSSRMNFAAKSHRTNTPSSRSNTRQAKPVITPAKRTTRAAAKKPVIVPEVSVEPPSSGASSHSSECSSQSSTSSTKSTSFAPPSFSFDFKIAAPNSAPVSSTPAKPQLNTVATSGLPVLTEMEDEVFDEKDEITDIAETTNDTKVDTNTEIENNVSKDMIVENLHINSVRGSSEKDIETVTNDCKLDYFTEIDENEIDPSDKPLPDTPLASPSQNNKEELQSDMTGDDTTDAGINENKNNKDVDSTGTNPESQSSEDCRQSQSSASSEEENLNKEDASSSTQPRRRSRRRSGVQPDPSLSQEELLLTPARRAKRRSASRERRKSGCGMCPGDDLCSATPSRSVICLPSLEESQEEDNTEEHNEGKEEEKVHERVRRSTRLSSNPGTPATSLAKKLDNMEMFKTPGKVKEKVPEIVANWVSAERGSSKRKKPGMDRKSFSEQKSKNSISTLFDDLDSSPVLALLERKAKSAEDITDEDFLEHEDGRPNKIAKLDMEQIATEEKLETEIVTNNVGNINTKCDDNDQVATNAETDIVRDVPYFRNLMKMETERLSNLGDIWEKKLLDNGDSISEDIQGSVRTCVGQARLVMSERFVQFSGLVDDCEFGRGEKETTTQDLTGFWEMIYFQVEDVDKKFKELEKIENNGWKEIENVKEVKRVIKPVKPKKVAKKNVAASSGLRAMIAAKRQAVSTSEVIEEKDAEPEVDERKTASTSGAEERDAKRLAVREMIARKKAELAKQRAAAALKDDSEKITDVENESNSGTTFDGGFFAVKSPARDRKANPSPARLTKSTGGDRLRRSVVITETARRVSGLMVSPFVSQLGKRSRENTPGKGESNEDKSPKTYSKCESPRSNSRQKQLEATFDDLVTSPSSSVVKDTHWSSSSTEEDEVRVRFTPGLKTDQENVTAPTTPHPKSGTKLESSPNSRRSRVSLMPMCNLDQEENPAEEVGDQELISFESPVLNRRKSSRHVI